VSSAKPVRAVSLSASSKPQGGVSATSKILLRKSQFEQRKSSARSKSQCASLYLSPRSNGPPLYEFKQKSMRAHRERRHLCHSIWALLSSRAATTIPTRHVVSLTSQIWRFPSTTATTHSWSCILTPSTPQDSQASVQSSLTNRAGHGSCRRRQFPKVSLVAWRMRLRLPSITWKF